jgi:hypothetical protein
MLWHHPVDQGLLNLDISKSHSIWHITLGGTPLDEWSARRRDLYLTTHNTHNRQDLHATGGIRTRNPSKRVAADPLLRPRGNQNWLITDLLFVFYVIVYHLAFLVRCFPHQPYYSSLFRLGEFCIADCVLLKYVQEGECSRYNRFVTVHTRGGLATGSDQLFSLEQVRTRFIFV